MMFKKYTIKLSCITLAIIMILSSFGVTSVLASVENGNVVLDISDSKSGSGLPERWVLFEGPESAVTFQNAMLTMSNEATTEQIAVNVHSVNSDGVRGDGRSLFDNALIEFKVRKDSYEDASFNILSGSGRSTVGSVVFGENGDVSVLSRNKETTGATNVSYTLENAYSLNEFFRVKIFIIPTERLFSVWINDKLVIDDVNFRGSYSYTYVPLFRFEIPAREAENTLKLDIADFFIRNTVTQAELSDDLAVGAASELVTLRDILNQNESADNILTDITLPTSVAVANAVPDSDGNVVEDVEIEWLSDNEDVINPLTGAVNRPTEGKPDATVVLTALFKKGDAEPAEREFEFYVPRIINPVYDAWYELEIARCIGTETEMMELTYYGNYDSVIAWESDKPEVIDLNGNVTFPEEVTQVKLTATISVEGYTSKTKEFNVLVIPDMGDSLIENASVITNALVANNIPGYAIDGDVNTLWKASKESGSYITIKFDEPMLFNKLVLRGIAEGVRTYKIEYTFGSDEWHTVCLKERNEFGADIIETQTFEADSMRFLVESANGEVGLSEIYAYYTTDDGDRRAEKDIEWLTLGDLSSVTDDIELPAVGEYGSDISWESGDEDIISDNGEVTRPKSKSSKKINVILTATVSNGETTGTKTFIAKVVPIVEKKSSGGGGSGGGSSVVIPSLPVVPESYVPITPESEPEPPQDIENRVFKDVDADHWAGEHIYALCRKGIISGVTEDTFEPERSITRAEFIKLVVTALKLETPDEGKSFDDVDENEWYAPFVDAAVASGIANGISENKFAPEQKITRQEIAVMICRAVEKCGIKINKSGNEIVFDDEEKIADWAKESVSILVRAGIINGIDSLFAPEDNATRAQAAKIINCISE